MSTWTHAGYVQSTSSKRTYEIKINEKGEYGCDCPAYKYQGKRGCKHIQQFTLALTTGGAPGLEVEVEGDERDEEQNAAIERVEAKHAARRPLKPCEGCGGLFTHNKGCPKRG